MAYEYAFKENSEIVKRRGNEKKSLSQLRTEFQKKLSEADTQLTEHLSQSNSAFEKYSQQIEDLKNKKEDEFAKWFENNVLKVADFEEESKKKIKDLESAYEELLRLEKPAVYWRKRSKKLKLEGWWAMGIMIVLLIAVSISLYYLLWESPEGMFATFIEEPVVAIKWAVIYITFISLMAYGIRILHKLAFSSFHLSRDAEEREQLTHVYLAMIRDSTIGDEE